MTTYDLTRPVEDGMPTYPGDPAVSVAPHATHERDGYRVSELHLGSHAGTHVDAPSHTEPDGRTLGEFPVAAFEFDARLIDCRDLGSRAPIGVDRVRDAVGAGDEGSSADAAADCDALVFDTGWAARWGTDEALDHPYLTAETAAWCAERGLHVGTDALNVDPTPNDRAGDGGAVGDDSTGVGDPSEGDVPNRATPKDEPEGVPAHHALLGADRLVIENLTNLDGLPDRFELGAYPLALDADGAPVRAVARVDAGSDADRGSDA